MSEYTYKDPRDAGYYRVVNVKDYAPNKNWKEFLFRRVEVYYHPTTHFIKIHEFMNWFGIALNILFSPLLILIHGLPNVARDLGKELNQKKHGAFVSSSYKLHTEEERTKVIFIYK